MAGVAASGTRATVSGSGGNALAVDHVSGDLFVNWGPRAGAPVASGPGSGAVPVGKGLIGTTIPADNKHYFVGREDIIAQIGSRFSSEGSLNALMGLAGIGKTEIATRIFHSTTHTLKIWLSQCDNLKGLQDQYQELILSNDIISREEIKDLIPEVIVSRVKTWLARQSNWLMVFDNAGDFSELKNYIPTGGDILITTRSSRWPSANKVAINLMNATDALKLTESIIEGGRPSDTDEERLGLIKTQLDSLPLAIAQAASFLKANPDMSISDYVKAFSDYEREVLDSDILPATSVHSNVWVTFQLSINNIKARHPEQVEPLMLLLQFMGHLAPTGVRKRLLIMCYKKFIERAAETDSISEVVVRQQLENLTGYALLQQAANGEVTMHCLMQSVVKAGLSIAQRAKLILSLIQGLNVEFYDHASPKCDSTLMRKLLPHAQRVVEHIQKDEALLTHIKAEQDAYAWLASFFNVLGLIYRHGVFDLAQAKRSYEQSIAYYQDCYRDEAQHYRLAVPLHNLANAYGDLGYVGKKKELLEQALRIQESHYGPKGHVEAEVARTLHSLGNAYGDLGDVVEKKKLLERALKINERHYGTTDHVEVAKTLHDLANAYGDLGDVVEKKKLLERVLNIFKRHHGTDDHVEVAIILLNLANACGELKEVTTKKELLEQALGIFKRHYRTENHVEVIKTLHNLAHACGELKKVDEKKELLEQVLEIEKHHYGTKYHLKVAMTLNNLAMTYGSLGDMDKEKELQEQVLEIQLRCYGQDNCDTSITRYNLAYMYYFKLEDYATAWSHIQIAKCIDDISYPEGDSNKNQTTELFNLIETKLTPTQRSVVAAPFMSSIFGAGLGAVTSQLAFATATRLIVAATSDEGTGSGRNVADGKASKCCVIC